LRKIADAIETDPVLCARILRLVNSAFYGVSGAIVDRLRRPA
jgi:HD-like signal output (HDOD) protein